MGCVASRIDKDESVSKYKERKKVMKQLLVYRKEFANAQLGYLRALKNTGVTLRQFTESESLEPEDIPFKAAMPSSPPPPLPPSPPPPPTFSPDLRNFKDEQLPGASQEEVTEINDDSSNTPPPPPVPSYSFDSWDPFGPSSPQYDRKSETVEQEEEDNWVETNSQFIEDDDDDDDDGAVARPAVNIIPEKQRTVGFLDDSSSVMSWHSKDTADMTMVVWRNKKSLAGIVRELDEYFLKAPAGGKDVAVLMDINADGTFLYHFNESKRNRYNSTKVFSSLSWNWSSKSLLSGRGYGEHFSPDEPCKLGAHCITLEKIYAEDQKLYKLVKEEETAKLEHERKSSLLKKQEEEGQDLTKVDKTRSVVENLQSDIVSLQQSISSASSTILKLINEELHPQMIALATGLMHMWQNMFNCHQVQNHISQQLIHLSDQPDMDPTTEYHRQAAAQLKAEVSSWHGNFCKLLTAQREYVQAICTWSQLTNCLADEGQKSIGPASVHAISKEWLLALDKLPDKVASEAIKSLISSVQSIVLHQDHEVRQKRRSDKLEKKLQRESHSLAEMERKFEGFPAADTNSALSSKHPLSILRAKVEALKGQVDAERAKYINSVNATRTIILSNLQTSLPNVFQALIGFSSTYCQALEEALSRATLAECNDSTDSV